MSKRARKLGLLGALYLSQGLPFGFFIQSLPVLMREQGFALSIIGLGPLLGMPWSLKFLWAPLVDRHGADRFGRRRSWIVPMQLLAALLMAVLAVIDPVEDLLWVFVGFFFASLFAATQDIATDALAVETLEIDERGLGNGVQVAGYRVGMIIGGGFLLIIYDIIGWSGVFLTMSGLLVLASVPILLHREPPKAHLKELSTPERGLILSYLKTPGIRAWLVVLVIYKSGESLATGMLRPFLYDKGLSLSDIGWLLGTGGFVAAIVGALFGGVVATRWHRQRALVALGVLQAVAVAGYALPAAGVGDGGVLATVTVFEHFASGAATAALFAAMMDRCREASAATDYTIQASAVVMATGSMAVLSGFVAELLGFVSHFVLATAICIVAVTMMARYRGLESSQSVSQ